MTAPPGSAGEAIEGTVVRRSSGEAWVDAPGCRLCCSLRGKLREMAPLVAGDRVVVTPTGPGTGAIERILPRRSELRRGGPGDPDEGRASAANLDQVCIVLSTVPAPPRWTLADRLLAEAGRQGLPSAIFLNKVDQAPPGSPERAALEEGAGAYRALSIPVRLVSGLTGEGIEELALALKDRISVLAGHSGVGKTTILNRIIPGAELPTGDVNPVTGKGRQTTTRTVLLPLPSGGYLMDTPGFREFALVDIEPPELGRLYPDFLDAIAGCRFKDCLHREEPGCALRPAVEAGRISRLRYQNYLQILGTLVDRGRENPAKRFARRRPPGAS